MLLNRGDTPPQGGVSRKVPEGREPLRALQHAKFLNGKAFCPIYLNLKNLKSGEASNKELAYQGGMGDKRLRIIASHRLDANMLLLSFRSNSCETNTKQGHISYDSKRLCTSEPLFSCSSKKAAPLLSDAAVSVQGDRFARSRNAELRRQRKRCF